MPYFSARSKRRLQTCHPDLQVVCKEAIRHFDFTIVWGHRNEQQQEKAHADNASPHKFPHSKHNREPSLAVDIAPWPLDWKNHKRFHVLAGVMLAVASGMGVGLRWGGNWDMDNTYVGNDLGHFELVFREV